MNDFFNDVWRGLNATPKYLQSKYFYDEEGDEIFREIMNSPEYYLTRCELEIFSKQTSGLTAAIVDNFNDFDLVELGAGDCMKSIYLLRYLMQQRLQFTYYPIDISKNVISQLNEKLPAELPGIAIHGLNGEYFDMLEKAKEISKKRKVIMFLGSSIGNIPFDSTAGFLAELKKHISPGDLVLIGFDLKKDPAIILPAYNDKGGITRRFNLNLLKRINKDLDADFDISRFKHSPEYNEATGACKSYLESLDKQRVRIGEEGWIHFDEGEKIFMEISQKYTIEQVESLAVTAGFKQLQHFTDSKGWFLDTVWMCE